MLLLTIKFSLKTCILEAWKFNICVLIFVELTRWHISMFNETFILYVWENIEDITYYIKRILFIKSSNQLKELKVIMVMSVCVHVYIISSNSLLCRTLHKGFCIYMKVYSFLHFYKYKCRRLFTEFISCIVFSLYILNVTSCTCTCT